MISDFPFTDVGRSVGLRKVFERIAETDLTEIDVTGLDLRRDKLYIVTLTLKNPTASHEAIAIYAEGDTTPTNYYTQFLGIVGTAVSCGRLNESQVAYVDAGERVLYVARVALDPDGYFRWYSPGSRRTGSAVIIHVLAGCKTAPLTNVTRLTFRAAVAGGIGAGSRLAIYSLF